MSGHHARPRSVLVRSAPAAEPSTAHGARHGRRERFTRRLRRRIFAYRDIEFLCTHIPGEPGTGTGANPGQECLLLVHIRKVVGQIHYRLCTTCGRGLITGVDIDAEFLSSGLPNRALSHLYSRHSGVTWRSAPALRTTPGLLRRIRVSGRPVGAARRHDGALCSACPPPVRGQDRAPAHR
ncbi:hypothetical protein [Streptomyces sp. NBC_00083]|uniref:hypothetical protein n=1 Tax=Streptomyces sp. NBC_00083 TaxID=2975647 RepID=UPI002254C9AE|nr:hypothetical protein [Streptomyces sp. NBC_00083]MCX5384805.1 hypothetical protein [Streptomyces sp. NBC_00083]